MDVFEAITTRASATALTEPGPSDAQIAALLQAGACAPDHGRLRPWRFLVVRGKAREELGDLMAAAAKARQPDLSQDALERERRKPLRAPLIVIVAANLASQSKIPEIEQILAAGAAAQNILLAAHGFGFGAIWRTGAPAYDPEVVKGLGLPESARIVGFLYIGSVSSPAARRSATETNAMEWTQGSSQNLSA
ncbi:nitroreductase family protein [Methylocystis bryophila]|uniref:Putative NAD(P)H nitroreductase n=1 Tax=Methylocystis bryophila TaxID=655015 RepID=A0A1W6MX54_9HYPH|nr:nitroreductase [Methylocystis bryophila]ARN82145.1 nitroreductase [Methylocystis bryophila]BDV38276.1 nitroreductase [Methylocystis bryophila]